MLKVQFKKYEITNFIHGYKNLKIYKYLLFNTYSRQILLTRHLVPGIQIVLKKLWKFSLSKQLTVASMTSNKRFCEPDKDALYHISSRIIKEYSLYGSGIVTAT